MNENNSSGIVIDYFGDTHVGLVRQENQDSLGKYPQNSNDVYLKKGQLFIVADGMGGHAHGKEASKSAIEIILQIYQRMPDENIASTLKMAIESANDKIFNSFKGNAKFQKMGTTVCALVIKENRAYLAHVGDSRIYHISKNKIAQVTTDHTVVSEMMKKGILSEAEAKTHPQRSVLNRAIGIAENVEVDITKSMTLQPGDIFVLCTDGLAKVTDEEISNIAINNNAEVACHSLINLANERGGKDNVTVQVIKVTGHTKPVASKTVALGTSPAKKKSKLLFALLLVLVVCILGIFLYGDIYNLFNSQQKKVADATEYEQEAVLTKKTIVNSSIDDLYINAENYYNTGNLDSSAIFYNAVLSKNPVHLSALDGLYKVSQRYKVRADRLFDQGTYGKALVIYKKAYTLQPEDMELVELISYCESQIKYDRELKDEEIAQNSSEEKTDTANFAEDPITENVNEVNIPVNKNVKSSFWKFDEVLDGDYKVNGNDVTFINNSRLKMVLNSYVIQGFTFEVEAKINEQLTPNRTGLIVGYNWDNRTSTDVYFLFSINKLNRFLLQKITDGYSETLVSIPILKTYHNENNTFKLKVKCLGNTISIYNNDDLLKKWDNASLIIGKIGLYADQNTNVEFTNFTLTPINE